MTNFDSLRKGLVLKEKNPNLKTYYIIRSIGLKSVKVLCIDFESVLHFGAGRSKEIIKLKTTNRLVRKDDWEYGDSGDTPNLWDPAEDKMIVAESDMKNLLKWIFKYG